MTKDDYKWLKDNNICTNCRKELACIGRHMCAECLDKTKEACEGSRSEASKEQRKQYIKEKRERCIEQGICRECLKRKLSVGKYCLDCYVKIQKKKEHKRQVWQSIGRCYFCGAKSEVGYKTCKKHHKTMANNLNSQIRDNSNHIWRKIQSGEVKNIQYWKAQNEA